MRVDVRKFLFYGAEEERKAFFSKAQEAGVIEFIKPPKVPAPEVPEVIHEFVSANKVLRHLEPAPQEELADLGEAKLIAKRINTLHQIIEGHNEETRLLKQEIVRVHAFGDFSPSDLRFIEQEGHRKIQFFFAKQGIHHDIPEALIQCGSALGFDYFVSIAPEQMTYEGFTEMKIDRPLGVLEKRLKEVEQERHEAEEELKTFAKRKAFLHKALIREMDHHNLLSSEKAVDEAFDGRLFSVMGWVSKHKIDQIGSLSSEVEFAEIEPDADDQIPTCLENKRAARIGEDLVRIYDTPSITDRDPSMWVLVFFSFFFAFIIGDAGYGFVFLAGSLFFTYKARAAKGLLKRFLRLCLILSVSCIVWGVLTTSFFGITIGADNPLRKISLITWLAEKKADYVIKEKGEDYTEWTKKLPELASMKTGKEWVLAKDDKEAYVVLNSFSDAVTMELALIIGIVHIILSLLRVIDQHWAGIGWILFLIGGYLYFPLILNATSMAHFLLDFSKGGSAAIGLQVLFIGIGAALILAPIQKKLSGLAEATILIQIFSDVLSYLRLYALALAGGMVSATFNDFAVSAGVIGGTLIIIVGHTINIALSIMGGIIHGLRLNFLEWYHYSFEGDGKMFNPLRLISPTG